MPHRKLTTDAERHRSKVDRSATPDGCWPWTGWIDPKGYGTFATGSYRDGTRHTGTRSHRFALEQALGRPILPGMQALHTCDARACCRNEPPGFYEVNGIMRPCYGHLFEGTPQDNMADRDVKGRGASEERNGPECYLRGELSVRAKLTAPEVRQMRLRAAAGVTQSSLAAEYGVTKGTVSHVISRRTWKHVT